MPIPNRMGNMKGWRVMSATNGQWFKQPWKLKVKGFGAPPYGEVVSLADLEVMWKPMTLVVLSVSSQV